MKIIGKEITSANQVISQQVSLSEEDVYLLGFALRKLKKTSDITSIKIGCIEMLGVVDEMQSKY